MNKEFTDKINVIIPVHEFNKDIEKLLMKAINSIPTDINFIVSCNDNVMDEVNKAVNKAKRENSTVISCDKSNFQELVNNAVNSLSENVEYFSILEFDDEYTPNWFANVEKYSTFYPETSLFMPITEVINFEDGKFVGYGNEAPWASSFSEEIGYIDNASLQDYYDYYMTGSVFNVTDWKNTGGLKESIKLSFWYEFLLRYMDNGKKVYVIPKTGYKHYISRKGSLYSEYAKTMSQEESTWWFKLAKSECFHKTDRKKEYTKTED